MEDVLEIYQRPYDPLRPVVCIDETNKQLIKETRIPCEPGQPEKVDSVYVRNGVADVFMISEPLAGRRETVVTQTRTALDFAEILRYTSDTLYPRTEKIVLVTDNLNTHSPASLYKAFPPEEAHRLAERFEWHYTPKHGSWLDMAEIEIGIMSRQALGKPLPDLESFKQQVRTWTIRRNAECAKINWQFKTQDARIKLARLYPVIVQKLTGCSTSKVETIAPADYEITYSKHTNAGTNTAKLIVTGKGSYAGSKKELTFTINPATVSATTAAEEVEQKNASSAKDYKDAMKVVVKAKNSANKEFTLVEGTDYTVTYGYEHTSDGNKVGNYVVATVTVTNKNFKGTAAASALTAKSKITAAILKADYIKLKENSFSYNGKPVTPDFDVVSLS